MVRLLEDKRKENMSECNMDMQNVLGVSPLLLKEEARHNLELIPGPVWHV